jgi:hypothetical protein
MRVCKVFTFLSLVLVILSLGLAVHAQSSVRDGKWKVEITYSKRSSSNPDCAGHLFPDPMVVTSGRISGILNHSDRGSVFLSGSVSEDGSFTAKGSGSGVDAVASGKLTKDGGSGTWEEKRNTYCDGTWTATKK